MSANHAAFNLIFRFVENYISPIAGRISSQRHVMAIRDGFISAMPFMIVGSFLLVFAYPPFSPDTTWGFARAWLDLAKEFEGRILTPFDMTMGIMSIYICAAISYNLGKHYEKSNQLDPFMCAMLSIMAFLLIAAPKTNGTLPVDSLGGTGIFTAILVAIYCVEMMRFLKAHNIGIRLPDQVPPMIKNSFDLLIPVLVVVLTLYPLSLFIQHHFDMLIPQAIMAIFKPLVSAADSLPAILLAVLIGHLLWFAGIHGAAIVSGMLQMFWLTNLGMNQQALAQGAPLPHIFMEAFWTFFIVVGGSGATMGLVVLLSAQPFSAFALHWSFERGAKPVQYQRAGDLWDAYRHEPSVLYSVPAGADGERGAGLGGNEAGSDWPRHLRRTMDGASANWRRLGAGLGFPGGDSGHCSGLRVGNHLLPIL